MEPNPKEQPHDVAVFKKNSWEGCIEQLNQPVLKNLRSIQLK